MPTITVDLSFFQLLLANPWIMLGLLVVFGIFIFISVLLIARHLILGVSRVAKAFEKKIILVTVPKEMPTQKDQGVMTAQQLQEKISVMETFFSAMAGLKPEKGFKAWLFGHRDVFSFEIVVLEGKINFFFAIPAHLRGYVEEQIQAQFPQAFVEEQSDYNIFSPKGIIKGTTLIFSRQSFFPVKTYKKFEGDPLNSLTNALSKIDEKDGAAIQIVFKSAPPSWRSFGVKVASKMQQGKKLKDALREAKGGFSKFARTIAKDFKGKSKDQGAPETYKLSPMEEELVKGIENKASKAGVDANIRILVSSESEPRLDGYLNNLANAFNQYNIYQYGNGFKTSKQKDKLLIRDFIYRNFDENRALVLNTEELSSLYHLPIPYINEAPNIRWLESKKAPAPLNMPTEGILLGYNIFRGKRTPIHMKNEDRFRHMYVIGMTGVGKTYLMSNLAMQDLKAGNGMCFIDPHGIDVEELLQHVPKERAEDVIYFDPTDMDRPIALNMLEFDNPEQKTFVVNEIMNIFDKLYDLKSTGGPIFEQYFKNACYLVMSDVESGSTLMEIPRVLADDDFRAYKLSKCDMPTVKDFWQKEAQKAGGEASLANMVPYITSKLAPFLANDMMRPIVSQQKSSINFKEAMAQKKIVLVKLAKGKIGNINAYLLGMIIIGKILMAAMGRVDMAKADRKDFFLYIDEFQNVLTDSIESILSEARKFRLAMIMGHQYIGQLVKGQDTKFKDAIFGNVGTKIAFRIGVDDAAQLTKEFAPVFSEMDFLNVPAYNCFVKELIDNANPPGFNMVVPQHHELTNISPANQDMAKAIKELSRLKYGQDRKVIEMEVQERWKKFGGGDLNDVLKGEDGE